MRNRFKAEWGVLDGWNKPAYSSHQGLPIGPDKAYRAPPLAGALSDLTTSTLLCVL